MTSRAGLFRSIFARAHAEHGEQLDNEWLSRGCQARNADGHPRPLAWSRRNGPWRQVDVLFVGAAPGNAGGRGSGSLGAHATLIPFGGDIAGANLDVLLASVGLTRDEIFLVAALNQLPQAGGGEPKSDEIAAPVGAYRNSLELLRDTIVATGPKLIVALGNVGLRATLAAVSTDVLTAKLPSLASAQRAGIVRNAWMEWPAATFPPHPDFHERWMSENGVFSTSLLPITHPSAQNMSPYARVETAFHTRMVDARDALARTVGDVLGLEAPASRAEVPARGPGDESEKPSIYDLPEWREAVGPRHATLDRLWLSKGV